MKHLLFFLKDKILLSLIILTILSNIITSFCNIETPTSFIHFFSEYNPYLITLMLVIIIPVIEELCFRGWIFKRQSLKILSFIFFAGYMILSFKFFGIICILLLFYSWFLDKNAKRRSIILLVLSSLIFSFIHYGNFDTVKPFLITLPNYLFIGLLLGYLAYKTQKIRLSIIVHILNNAIAIAFLLFYTPIPNSEFILEKEHLNIQIKKESVFKRGNTMITNFENKEYSHITIPELVAFFKPVKERVYVKTTPSLAYYSVKINSTNGETIDDTALADILSEKFNLKMLTEQKKTVLYGVKIVDSSKLLLPYQSEPFSVNAPLSMFFESLERHYQIPIDVEDSVMNKYSEIKLFHSIKKDMTFEKECERLLHRGVKLYPKDSIFVEIITISY